MSPTEPESYDIQSMLERLKNRETGDEIEKGELVTRADGSQAIRVRKRKRRTQQPHKDRQHRVRVMQVTVALVVLVLLVFGFGCLTVYVNSPPYRKEVLARITGMTGAEARLNQFRMNPTGINAAELEMHWPAGNVLEQLSLRAMHGDVSPMSLFGGALKGESFDADAAVMVLRVPDASMPVNSGSLIKGSMPIDFEQYGMKDFTLRLQHEGVVAVGLEHAEANYMPPAAGRRAQLILSKGVLNVRNWPSLDFDRAHVEFKDGQADIVGMRLRGQKDEIGVMELSGVVNPYDESTPATLRLQADSFPLSGILGQDFGKLIAGRVDSAADQGSGHLGVRFGKEASASFSLPFRGDMSRPMQLRVLPFLFGLSQTLGDEWFAQPEFMDEAMGVIVRDEKRVGFSRLELMSKGRLILRGHLFAGHDGTLTGRMEVGVAQGMIAAAEDRALHRMFGEAREGYRWIDLEIGGTLVSPTDGFSQLYDKALQQVKQEPAEPQGAGVPTFEELTKPR